MKKHGNQKLPAFLFLCAALLGAASCGADSAGTVQETASPVQTAGTETVTDTAETDYTAEALPAKDFGGAEFNVLVNNNTNDYRSLEFFAEGTDGTVINDAVFLRNEKVQSEFNVKIMNRSHNDETKVLQNSVSADDNAYDLALIALYNCGKLVVNGYLADFYELPYLDFSGAWWDKNAVRDLSLGHRLYITIGDLNINDKDMTWCLFFDKTLAERYDLPDLYQMVSEKKWTMDVFAGLCKNISADINGDGVYDDNDLWGHVTVLARSAIGYMYSMGTSYIVKDENDYPILKEDNEMLFKAYDRIMALYTDGNTCHDIETMPYSGYDHQWRKCEAMFGNQQILFYAEAMQNAERFRGFENNFGILPLPSAEEGEYGSSMVWMQSYATVLPATVLRGEENEERVGLILEAVQRASHDTVVPAYYEKALKGKYSRDESSGAMIDLIFGNRFYDIASYYGWGGLSNAIQDYGKACKENLASLFAKYHDKTIKDIEETVDMLKENAD